MPLSDSAVRAVKAIDKPLKLYDERGLFLLVQPSGGKWWRFKYRFHRKEKLLSLGTYPDTGLREAREKRDEARRLLAQGVDPSLHRRESRAMAADAAANSFESVAVEWLAKFSPTWTPSYHERLRRFLARDAFPYLGARPVAAVTAQELLACLRRTEERAPQQARRLRQVAGQLFRYAVATGRAEHDPSAALRGAMPALPTRHHAAITEPREIGGLMRAIDGYQGSPVVRAALRLAALVFVRPGELRQAEWAEVDLEAAEWRIPAGRMKMREQHVVPLSRQAVAILREVRLSTGKGRYVFASLRTAAKSLSPSTLNAALRNLGIAQERMTAHGFRAMASTRLNELGWAPDVIERQLAHAERNKVRAAYNHAQHLPERRRMLQEWADYLDGLRADVPADARPAPALPAPPSGP